MKARRRLTSFDLLTLFLILSLGVLLVGHVLRRRETPPTTELSLTFVVRGIDPRYADAIEGAKALTLDGFPLEPIASRRTAARRPLPDGSGSYESSLLCDLTLETMATGTVSPDGFAIGGRRALSPGMSLTLSSPDLVVEAVLWRIAAKNGGRS